MVSNCGAEVIPFLKTYVNLPGAIAFTVLYSKMTDRMSQKNVYRSIVVSFLAFFASFALILYPNAASIHPHAFCNTLAAALPAGCAAPIGILRYWSFSLFYLMAEMWGSVVVSLLFWGFANTVTTVDEAKKYYPLFGMGANIALIFSGQYVRLVSMLRAAAAPGVDGWGMSLKLLMGGVLASGGVMLGLYEHMQRNVMTDPNCVDPNMAPKKSKKKKPKMSMGESFKFLADSKYIRNLATLVVSYGMAINIVEVSWKSKLKQAFADPNAYSAFMGSFSSATGAVTFAMMLIGRSIFAKFGWKVAALVTPTMIGVTGLAFFSLTLFSGFFTPLAAAIGMTPLMLAVYVGAAQNILSKSSKYSLFDPCKEMAYIPLDEESKTKGKAAVDVIGNPLGKSGGAFIQQVLIFGVGSLAASTPYLAAILGLIVFSWFKSASSLSVQFEEAMAKGSEDVVDADVVE
jgi:AAA family ATP:ADP antiporter